VPGCGMEFTGDAFAATGLLIVLPWRACGESPLTKTSFPRSSTYDAIWPLAGLAKTKPTASSANATKTLRLLYIRGIGVGRTLHSRTNDRFMQTATSAWERRVSRQRFWRAGL
jgi:hypothetical protein